MTLVMKFGGSSLADAGCMRQAASLVEAALPQAPLVVLSAMGKTTNSLIEKVEPFGLRNPSGLAGNPPGPVGKPDRVVLPPRWSGIKCWCRNCLGRFRLRTPQTPLN